MRVKQPHGCRIEPRRPTRSPHPPGDSKSHAPVPRMGRRGLRQLEYRGLCALEVPRRRPGDCPVSEVKDASLVGRLDLAAGIRLFSSPLRKIFSTARVGNTTMGAGTRQQELRQRRHRKEKRRKQRLHQLLELLQQGRTHEERVKIAQEFWQKARPSARSA